MPHFDQTTGSKRSSGSSGSKLRRSFTWKGFLKPPDRASTAPILTGSPNPNRPPREKQRSKSCAMPKPLKPRLPSVAPRYVPTNLSEEVPSPIIDGSQPVFMPSRPPYLTPQWRCDDGLESTTFGSPLVSYPEPQRSRYEQTILPNLEGLDTFTLSPRHPISNPGQYTPTLKRSRTAPHIKAIVSNPQTSSHLIYSDPSSGAGCGIGLALRAIPEPLSSQLGLVRKEDVPRKAKYSSSLHSSGVLRSPRSPSSPGNLAAAARNGVVPRSPRHRGVVKSNETSERLAKSPAPLDTRELSTSSRKDFSLRNPNSLRRKVDIVDDAYDQERHPNIPRRYMGGPQQKNLAKEPKEPDADTMFFEQMMARAKVSEVHQKQRQSPSTAGTRWLDTPRDALHEVKYATLYRRGARNSPADPMEAAWNDLLDDCGITATTSTQSQLYAPAFSESESGSGLDIIGRNPVREFEWEPPLMQTSHLRNMNLFLGSVHPTVIKPVQPHKSLAVDIHEDIKAVLCATHRSWSGSGSSQYWSDLTVPSAVRLPQPQTKLEPPIESYPMKRSYDSFGGESLNDSFFGLYVRSHSGQGDELTAYKGNANNLRLPRGRASAATSSGFDSHSSVGTSLVFSSIESNSDWSRYSDDDIGLGVFCVNRKTGYIVLRYISKID